MKPCRPFTRVLVATVLLAPFTMSAPPAPTDLTLTVHVGRPAGTMRGGIGASWHALVHDWPLENERYAYPIRTENPRGSAYGGNPPLANDAAWQQVYHHAAWLGLDWLRVEVSQAMYERERGVFDWERDEMQVLYRILDWCERHGADVFLQQMWREVAWNAYPGVQPILSAPYSVDAFAESSAALLEHLVRRRGYTCVRWYCITNEPPGGTWGYWWETGDHPPLPLAPVLAAVRRALDRRGLDVPLSGPDWTDLPPLEPHRIDFDASLGAYDIHSYQGMDATRQATLADWARWAHARGKPLFLSEMGDMRLGWGTDDPGPKGFAAALSNAETVLRGLRVGVDAFNRWSFLNRGDLDGQWQLVRTWDRAAKAHLPTAEPEPVAYFGYAILTRFLPKHATRVDDRMAPSGGEAADSVLTATLLHPGGAHLTTLLLNLAHRPYTLHVRYDGLDAARPLYRYRVTAPAVEAPGFTLAPEPAGPAGDGVAEALPPRSITVLTTRPLQPGDPGLIR